MIVAVTNLPILAHQKDFGPLGCALIVADQLPPPDLAIVTEAAVAPESATARRKARLRRSISMFESGTPSFTGAGSSGPRLSGASLSSAFGAGISGQFENVIAGGALLPAGNKMNKKLPADFEVSDP